MLLEYKGKLPNLGVAFLLPKARLLSATL